MPLTWYEALMRLVSQPEGSMRMQDLARSVLLSKSGVTRACRYEPELQRSYEELALHYGTVILPARPASPRDKAKVEVGVQVAERWILARPHHQRFFGLVELSAAIRQRDCYYEPGGRELPHDACATWWGRAPEQGMAAAAGCQAGGAMRAAVGSSAPSFTVSDLNLCPALVTRRIGVEP